MSRYASWARAMIGLGPANIARVAAYRIGLRLGVHPAQRINAILGREGAYFSEGELRPVNALSPSDWRDTAPLFGKYRVPVGDDPPDWHSDPFVPQGTASATPNTLAMWWEIGDFSGGDIKSIWELSRFDWALAFAQQARNGDSRARERLERWIGDWADENPPYRGPNWKCAQEASIRVLHLSLAAIILGTQREVAPALRSLVDAHLRRILPTLSFARAQDNNHATSEAAALYVAGAWYQLAGIEGADQLVARGSQLLERSVERLFCPDGSFSQASVNYHRLALDTLSVAEIWRRKAGLAPFSETFTQRAKAAARWLRAMTDPVSGNAPNLGANDGANLLPLTGAAYRDHRPSVQLACHLFGDFRPFEQGPWDDAFAWLDLAGSIATQGQPLRQVFDEGGYAVIRNGRATAVLRYPRFRFRPSQCDVLHLDFWSGGENLLRDAGSYSYNTDQQWIDYFGGVEAHNTIQFDGLPQMPRLSRFLLGDWLETTEAGSLENGFFAACRHPSGAYHRREFTLNDTLRVVDTIEGFSREARLRWRLAPGTWRVGNNSATDGAHELRLSADAPLAVALCEGWESRHYHEKTPLPVVEAVVTQPCTIVSEYRWSL